MKDIVYFVKETKENEELRYSLRSLSNFPHGKVWFYGGCPDGLNPDFHVPVKQDKDNKWKNVSMMLDMACNNQDITKEFWLFNDDFFIMEKIEHPKNYYRGDLYKRIVQLEDVYKGFKRVNRGSQIISKAPVNKMSTEGRIVHQRVSDRMAILQASLKGASAELKELSKKESPFAIEKVGQM